MLLIFSIVASNCFADDSLPGAINLAQGSPAPYAGVLLSKEKAKIIYGELIDYDKVKLINESLETSIKLHEENETIYLKEVTEVRDQNLVLQTAVEAAQSNSFWIKALWFGIGFALAGVTVHAIDKH